MLFPQIIQGGMGVAVSGWRLARAVSMAGQLGVVSGTALAVVLARRLQDGDADGHVRQALLHFPVREMAQRVLDAYFMPGGRKPGCRYKLLPFPTPQLQPALLELTVVANFVEVFLAKQGHDGLVGINYLERVQIPTLASLYGAMMAGVDFVMMGAGIPRFIPGVLDRFAAGEAASLRLDALDLSPGRELTSTLDPAEIWKDAPIQPLKRPKFLGVVSSATLALTLARKSTGRVDGFIVEESSAGGHNAPPRGPMQLNARGEPIYGPRDLPDFARYAEIGLPFWLAGSYGRAGGLKRALAVGAIGIQVGTAFAFCEESGIDAPLKARVLQSLCGSPPRVHTDPLASPTGFPFKVLQLERTISETEYCEARQRICDLGYLRTIYQKADGAIGYRCPAEPVEHYLSKGGTLQETVGRKCVCNALISAAGMGQTMANGNVEPPIVTAGDHIADIVRFLSPEKQSYTATDVIESLLADDQGHVAASAHSH